LCQILGLVANNKGKEGKPAVVASLKVSQNVLEETGEKHAKALRAVGLWVDI
jgi:hypothetical protein